MFSLFEQYFRGMVSVGTTVVLARCERERHISCRFLLDACGVDDRKKCVRFSNLQKRQAVGVVRAEVLNFGKCTIRRKIYDTTDPKLVWYGGARCTCQR